MGTTHTVSLVVDASGFAKALRVPAYSLKVLKGPDQKREKRFAQQRLVVGTATRADFKLTDETVSALHCELIADERGVKLKDLGAKNGVSIDGRRVGDAYLKPKDELVLGETILRFKLLDEAEDQVLPSRTSYGRLLGASPRMRELYDQLVKASSSDASVLLVGETGTGKDLAADAIFSEGQRKDKPLVVLECGQLPINLAESELFGHEANAFTGAAARRLGAFERAHGGTILLDEVGELPLALQPKLLGVLERRVVQRLGGSQDIPVDVRVIAASQRDLAREVNRGTFRADLFYRLAGVEIHLPALREHPEDIPALVAHFLEEVPNRTALSPQVLERLYRGDYPGNVRQLRAMVERAALGFELQPFPVPEMTVTFDIPYRVQKAQLVAGFDRVYFARLLEASKKNVSEAARKAGLSRMQVYEIMHRLGL